MANTDPDDLRVQPGPEGRAVVRRVRRLRHDGDELQPVPGQLRTTVRQRLAAVRSRLVDRQAADTPIEQLRDGMTGRVHLGTLEAHGYRSVRDVARADPEELDALPRVDTHTAHEAVRVARLAMEGMDEDVTVRLDPDQRDAAETRLLAAAWRYDRAQRSVAEWDEEFTEFRSWVDPLVRPAARVSRRFRLFLGRESRERGLAALQELDARLADERTGRLAEAVAATRRVLAEPQPGDDELWRDYERRPVEVNMLLAGIGRADSEADEAARAEATGGYVPAELAERVRRHELDTSCLKASLRGYQAFGAKFALSQRRAILGDEMGLGKTIEAIATIGHLHAKGATHFLAVCPASVLANWVQEVAKHSELTALRIHGADRDGARGAVAQGGRRRRHHLRVAAHARRPVRRRRAVDAGRRRGPLREEPRHAKRSQARASAGSADAERVLFLTGTPMENRVEEFRNLVDHIRPAVAALDRAGDGLAGAEAFRPPWRRVYLRRNQADVLAELPERIDSDEWVELDAGRPRRLPRARWRRGTSWPCAGPPSRPTAGAQSAKLHRLVEIVDEAAENGWKVVVFSSFRGRAPRPCRAGARRGGPSACSPADSTADVAPGAGRRVLGVDRSRAVLVSQIQAGGVGLNIQAASVVVLAEPQWKPSIEDQAVARCHRMGQVRPVQVHRLLAEDVRRPADAGDPGHQAPRCSTTTCG